MTLRDMKVGERASVTAVGGSGALRQHFLDMGIIPGTEITVPIVSIAGFAKLLKRKDLTAEQQKEYIDIIEEESLRLANMATGVLELTKVENQTSSGALNTYNLSEQIRGCVLLLEKRWAEKGLEPELIFDEYEITANEDMINSAVTHKTKPG